MKYTCMKCIGRAENQSYVDILMLMSQSAECIYSVTVGSARFVTAGAIDIKCCTYVPLGQMTSQTKFLSDLIHVLVTRGPNPKTQVLLLLNYQTRRSICSSRVLGVLRQACCKHHARFVTISPRTF
jgi:hypothetical protein